MIWLDRKNIADINKLWYSYTVLKTSLGATFNVKLELCKIIVGFPPIDISNKIHGVKHFSKLNLNGIDAVMTTPSDP